VELRGRQDLHRQSAWHDALEPAAAAHATGQTQHLAQRRAERQLEQPGALDVAGYTEQCRARALVGAARAEPLTAPLEDVGRVRGGLVVVHRGRQAERAELRRDRRFLSRLALLALE